MNLHLMQDDKFIDGFIRDWEQHDQSEQNVYVIRDRARRSDLRYVREPRAICAAWGSTACRELVGEPLRYRKIFVHYFGPELYDYVARIPTGVAVLWCFWGGDFFFPTSLYASASLDSATQELMARRRRRGIRGVAATLRTWQHDLRWYARKRAALARVDYMLHWNILDFDAVTRETRWKARFLPFDYDGGLLIEEQAAGQLSPQLSSRIGGRRVVLLGNSATPSNNHVSALRRLADVGLPKDVLVICPLAYGDEPYGDAIAEAGKCILGEQFEALRAFMPLPEYRALLDRVDVGIMNHARTQAGSNVIGLLCRGKRVFMNERSTLYQMLSIGDALVQSLEEVRDPDSLFDLPSQEDVANTRNFLDRRFGKSFRERSLARIARA